MSNFDETLNLIDGAINRKLGEIKEVKVLLDEVEKEIDVFTHRAPSRPSKTLADFDNSIENLRHQLSVMTLPVHIERDIIRQISNLTKEKDLLGPWGQYEVALNVLKEKRKGIADCLASYNGDVQKLRDGRKVVEATKRAQALNPGVEIHHSDIVVEEVHVNDDALPRIIGRKGSSLKEIEDTFAVVIEVDEGKSRQGKAQTSSMNVAYPLLRIRGLASCIAAAKERVSNVSDQVEGSCPLSNAMFNWMISNDNTGIKVVEDLYAVRVHVSRAGDKSPQAVFRGLIEDINAAKSAIAHAERSKKYVSIGQSDIPRLVGNKGIHIRRLEEETTAGFSIEREGNTEDAKIWIAAFGPDAASIIDNAFIAVQNHVAENAEVEVPIIVTKDFCPWIVGKGGKRINQFQTDTGVFARVVRPGTSSDIANLPSDAHAVVLKGSSAAIANAQVELNRLLNEFSAEHVQIPVTSQQARVLTGPGGTIINSLRSLIPKDSENKQVASIDISDASGEKESEKKGDKSKRINRADELGLPVGQAVVTIRGDAATVASLTTYVKQLLPSIQNPKFSFPTARCIVLSRRGDALRNLENETQAFVEVEVNPDSEESVISFLGLPAGVSAIQNKLCDWKHVVVPLKHPLIFRDLTTKIKDLASLQVDGVFVELVKDPARIIIAGPPDAVNGVHSSVSAMLLSYHTIEIDTALIPTLIGPKGATINAISEETKATILVDDSGVVLVHGESEVFEAAMVKINDLCRLDAPSVTVPFVPGSVSRIHGKGSVNIRKIQTEHNVSIISRDATSEFVIRGASEDVENAAVALRKLIREFNRVEQDTTIPEKIVGVVIGSGGTRLKALTESTNTSIDISKTVTDSNVAVKVRGTTVGINKVFAFLEALSAGKNVKYITRPTLLSSNLKNSMKLSAVTPFGASVKYFPADEPVEGEEVKPNDVQFMDFVLVVADDEVTIDQTLYAVDSLLFGNSETTVRSVKLSGGLVNAAVGPKKSTKKAVVDALSPVKIKEKFGVSSSLDGAHITLWGPPTSVADAVSQIESIKSEWDATHAEVSIPTTLIPLFVGRDGAKLNQLKSKLKISIDVERSDVGSNSVLVLEAVDANALEKGREVLEEQINNLVNLRIRYSVPRSACLSIIGKGGSTIRGLQTDNMCFLDVDVGTATISVIGESAEGFEKVKSVIAEHASAVEGTATVITDAQYSQLSEKVPVKPLLQSNVSISAFVGKNGANLENLSYHLGREGAQFTAKDGVVTVLAPTPALVAQGVQALKDAAASFNEGDAEIAPTFTAPPVRSSNLPVGLSFSTNNATVSNNKQAKSVLPVQPRASVVAKPAQNQKTTWVTVGTTPKDEKQEKDAHPVVVAATPSPTEAKSSVSAKPVVQMKPAPVVAASDSTTALLASIFGESEAASMLGINTKKSSSYVTTASSRTVTTGKSFASITASAPKQSVVLTPAPLAVASSPLVIAPTPQPMKAIPQKAAPTLSSSLPTLQPLAPVAIAPIPLPVFGTTAAPAAPESLPSLGAAPIASPVHQFAISPETLASLTPDIVALLQSQTSPMKPLTSLSHNNAAALPFPLPSLSHVAPPPGLPGLSPSLKPLAAPPGLGVTQAPKSLPFTESNEKKFVPRPGPVWGKTSKA